MLEPRKSSDPNRYIASLPQFRLCRTMVLCNSLFNANHAANARIAAFRVGARLLRSMIGCNVVNPGLE